MNKLAIVACLVAAASACTDQPSCATWVKNGFCSNPDYYASRAAYCPKACGLCGGGGGTGGVTSAPLKCTDKDINMNCAKWQTSKNVWFCSNPTVDWKVKEGSCCVTCKDEVANKKDTNVGCVVYTGSTKTDAALTAKKLKTIKKSATAAAGDADATGFDAAKELVLINSYVSPKCTIKYGALAIDTLTATAEAVTTDGKEFVKVPDAKSTMGFALCQCD